MTAAAATFNEGPTQGEELWTHDVFGCFGDLRICIFTFLVPCYTIGRNGEELGEDGCVIGVLYGLGLIPLGAILRWRIRQKKNIRGSMVADVVLHMFCPCCALIQENKELYGADGSHLGEKIPINIERK